jgi:diaminopimelate decarboxylase
MKVIDIGGGYPGTKRAILFEDIASIIRKAKESVDSEIDNLEWIGEPGRFMVASSSALITEVIGTKKVDQSYRYYLNE